MAIPSSPRLPVLARVEFSSPVPPPLPGKGLAVNKDDNWRIEEAGLNPGLGYRACMDRVGEICLRTWAGGRREGREVGWWRVGIRGMSSFFFFFSLVVEKCGTAKIANGSWSNVLII